MHSIFVVELFHRKVGIARVRNDFFCILVRDRVRTKMERDILADVSFPFIVNLHYGKCLVSD